MNRRRNSEGTGAVARNWVLNRADEVVAEHENLTSEGWSEDTHTTYRSRARRAALRDEFNTRRAKAEIIATLVTIAIQAIPPEATVDWLVQQTLWVNGIEVRQGTAIVAAIIAGYEPLLGKSGHDCGFRRRVSS
jgi:hypothetical protein